MLRLYELGSSGDCFNKLCRKVTTALVSIPNTKVVILYGSTSGELYAALTMIYDHMEGYQTRLPVALRTRKKINLCRYRRHYYIRPMPNDKAMLERWCVDYIDAGHAEFFYCDQEGASASEAYAERQKRPKYVFAFYLARGVPLFGSFVYFDGCTDIPRILKDRNYAEANVLTVGLEPIVHNLLMNDDIVKCRWAK